MKTWLLCICYICICCTGTNAQQLKETSYYMQLPNVSQAAKDYHSGTMAAGDNDRTYSIADSMNTEEVDTRPFYIYLVSKMLLNANKQFINNMSTACRHFIQNDPDALVGLLFSKGVKPDYRNAWARAIATDIYISCKTSPMLCFKTARSLSLERCSEPNKEKLEVIFNMVRTQLKTSKL